MKMIYALVAIMLLLVSGCIAKAGNTETRTDGPAIAQKVVANSNAPSSTEKTVPESQVAETKNTTASVAPPTPPVKQLPPPSLYGDVKALPASASGAVIVPLSEISTTMKKYSYDVNGTTVRFFVVLGSDGKVRAAFDACQVCYKAKKGYSQVNNNVRCNNCGRQFSIDDLGTENKGAGCWPSYLPNEVNGSDVRINVSDLQAGTFLFS